MSVATEIQRIKTAIANAYTAVSGKGGTVPQSAVVGNLPTAIGTIPTETPLPTLTNPAAAGDILSGKEAIDGQGAKLTGTFDPLEDTELDPDFPPEIVSGELSIELTHGQDFFKELTYSVPDALPENIVEGKSILGVSGTAKKVEVVKGTITQPSTRSNFTVPALSSAPKAFIVFAQNFETLKQSAADDVKPVYAASSATFFDDVVTTAPACAKCLNASTSTYADLSVAIGAIQASAGFRASTAGTNARFIGGINYDWEAYYWEDD